MSADYMSAYSAALNTNLTTEERQQELESIQFRLAKLQEEVRALEGSYAGHQAMLKDAPALPVGTPVVVTGPDEGGITEHLLGRTGILHRRSADLSAVVSFDDGYAPQVAYFPDTSLERHA